MYTENAPVMDIGVRSLVQTDPVTLVCGDFPTLDKLALVKFQVVNQGDVCRPGPNCYPLGAVSLKDIMAVLRL